MKHWWMLKINEHFRPREIIDTLHINYGYDGNYPIDDVDEEFQRCRDLVEQFVDDLEQAASGDSP